MTRKNTAPITLTTDFGTSDHYVGVMKGVIMGILPGVTIVDITHEVPPQDIAAGAYHLESAWRYFPPGSVHVAVVDPGVGSSRRAIAVAAGGHFFVGPDNGLLAFALDEPGRAVFEIENPEYVSPSPSATFHGRDIFAPAAAWLARGIPIEQLGSAVNDPLRIDREPERLEGAKIHARVLHTDRFGNVVLSVTGTRLAEVVMAGGQGRLRAEIGSHRIERFVTHYAAADGNLCFLINSDGRLEIALPGGSAALSLGLRRGYSIVLTIA